ncbi:MAG: DUF4386 domain-containing protein [Alphaproteobacteria bacterium]|nr:DUF4386 domain-containing protein [Alphaproteobacteria bacterium]MBU1525201.1 DUF4386 domain-containing protein [Alphaproteobacteria bacterium]MBU2116850.1 DUF4386 domain-containing protein [Alphaproteobacteria bacterium]MBU2352197.1 DUF4386 domain-containing protein [Alphaproteobacteria bacterium]MBU2381207.1 DUF4386 domain-containing protein [Alphaproteobacteria bacterium]
MISSRRKAGAAMIAFALAVNGPYLLLIDRFGYDDVLREPPLEVLAAFRAGGPELILIWLAFAACSLAFLWVSAWTGTAVEASGRRWPAWAAAAGAGSAIAQAVGLSRWSFVVPGLADRALDGSALESAVAVGAYQTLHQFAGVAIGEWLGQTLMAAWTLAIGLALVRGPMAVGLWTRALGLVALILTPLWIVGHAELLATVHSAFPDVQITQWVFTAWLVWLLALGVTWLVQGDRK